MKRSSWRETFRNRQPSPNAPCLNGKVVAVETQKGAAKASLITGGCGTNSANAAPTPAIWVTIVLCGFTGVVVRCSSVFACGLLSVALSLGGCASNSAVSPAAPTGSGSVPGSSSSTPSATPTKTPLTVLPLAQSCEATYPHITTATKLLSKFVDSDGEDTTAEQFYNVLTPLFSDKARAPSTLQAPLQGIIGPLLDASQVLTIGGTFDEVDAYKASVSKYIAVCEGGGAAPKPDPTPKPKPAPKPIYSKAESRYLKAYAADWDDETKPSTALREGRKACSQVKEHTRGYSRNRYLLNKNRDTELAVKYLCTRFVPDLKRSKRAIYEGDYTVGEEVRPGTYRTEPKTRKCYWERSTKGGDILANDYVTFAARGVTVTIRSSDGGFSTNGCGPWIPV